MYSHAGFSWRPLSSKPSWEEGLRGLACAAAGAVVKGEGHYLQASDCLRVCTTS